MTASDLFHAHLDDCRHCEESPFNLCAIGADLIKRAGDEMAVEVAAMLGPLPFNAPTTPTEEP